MSATPMSHGRCVQRVCCSSWSCTPHLADCPSVHAWARPMPLVFDFTVPRGRVELRNEQGQVVGHIGVPS